MKRSVLQIFICSFIFFIFLVLPVVSQTEQGVEVKDAPRIDPDSLATLME